MQNTMDDDAIVFNVGEHAVISRSQPIIAVEISQPFDSPRSPEDDSLVDVYELIINGQEISPGYSELNDRSCSAAAFSNKLVKRRKS